MKSLKDLKIKLFSDGAALEDFRQLSKLSYIKGFTTNPSLMRKAGVTDYEGFIKEALPIIGPKPISFEVIGDDFTDMKAQALKLAGFAENIYVKIPIMNTKGEPSIGLVGDLTHNGVKVNVTAILTSDQVKNVARVLKSGAPSVVSVFAGRIADTGVDPVPIMKESKAALKGLKNVELLWASTRELLNIFQADEVGCEIITVPPDILKKLNTIGRNLHEFSLDTVKIFYNDTTSSGFKLNTSMPVGR